MTTQAEFPAPTISVRTEPVQQRSSERITSLLDAAAALIDESGIDGLTTSDVAARSGSSVGVVYRYFPNIQSLLRGLAARNMEKFSERVFGALSPDVNDWLDSVDSTIDAYVELSRTEPGFRALRFGDIIDERFIQPDVTNNTLVSRAFADLYIRRWGGVVSDEFQFDLEIIVEIADALLHRAFIYDRNGDERFIEKLRVIIREYMAPHVVPSAAQ